MNFVVCYFEVAHEFSAILIFSQQQHQKKEENTNDIAFQDFLLERLKQYDKFKITIEMRIIIEQSSKDSLQYVFCWNLFMSILLEGQKQTQKCQCRKT